MKHHTQKKQRTLFVNDAPANINEFFNKHFLKNKDDNPLLTSFSMTLPLTGREEIIKNVYTTFVANFATFQDQARRGERSQHTFPLIATIPGVGKSRMNQDLPLELLKIANADDGKEALKHCVRVCFTLGNGSPLTAPECNCDNVNVILGTRALYFYFVHEATTQHYITTSLQTFMHEIYKADSGVSLKVALQAIVLDYHMRTKTTAKMVYLGIDEFQTFDDKQLKDTAQVVFDLMKSEPYFVFPFLTGLELGLAQRSFKLSGLEYKIIPLPLLQEQHVNYIIDTVFASHQALQKWRINTGFRDVLRSVHGHGRSIEWIITAIKNAGYKMPSPEAIERFVKEKLSNQLTTVLKQHTLILPLLLRDIVFGKEVDRETKVGINSAISYSDLEAKGLIIFEKNKIIFPYYFFELCLEQFDLHHHVLCGFVWWQEFEYFIFVYMRIREEVLRLCKQNSVSISEFFAGAIISKNIHDLSFEIDLDLPITLCISEKQFPTSKNEIFEATFDGQFTRSNARYDWDAIHTIVLNCASASFGDVFAVRQAINHGKKKIIFSYQCKLYKETSITLQTIKDEIEKNEKAAASLDCIIVTVIFTTDAIQPLISKLKQLDNVIIIGKEQARKFYGSVFVDRSFFAGGQTVLRINEWNHKTLQSWRGIGEKKATKILKYRSVQAFRTLEDVAQHVGKKFAKQYGDFVCF